MTERANFTKKQRQIVLDRDDNTSQLRIYSEEKGWTNGGMCEHPETCRFLEVNHITPAGAGGKNEPTNGLTVHKCRHVGYCPDGRIVIKHGGNTYHSKYADTLREFVIHPDQQKAYKEYGKKGNEAFKELFQARDEKLARGEIYHNDSHDEEMRETAEERTLMMPGKGLRWPIKKAKERCT